MMKLKSIFSKWKTKPEPEPESQDNVILTDDEHKFLVDMIIHNPPPRNLPPLKRQHAQTMYLSVYRKFVEGAK